MNRQFLSIFSLAICSVLFMDSCSPGERSKDHSGSGDELESLEGSWKLEKFIDHGQGGTKWESYSSEVVYQKHLTPTHFTWFRYDSKNDILIGAGGGRYKFNGTVYTEYIEFFHPPGSSLLGQAIPFDVEFEKGIWFHSGYSKELEFDPEVGDLVIIDTTKIEEQWARIDGTSEHGNMLKTWNLIGYKMDPAKTTYDVYPDFVRYVKLLTPTHFTWIRYHSEEEGGEVLGLGSGTWEIRDKKYTEHIKVMHPSGSQQINTVITFDMDILEKKWYHKGYVKRVMFNEDGEETILDSSLVDEIWMPEFVQ